MPRTFFTPVGLLVSATFALGAEPPQIEAFRVNATSPAIFHLRFHAPDDLIPGATGNDPVDSARLPRLINDTTQPVHLRFIASTEFKQGPLEFVGLWPANQNTATEEAEFRLLYPIANGKVVNNGKDAFDRCSWVEVPIVLKWKDAMAVAARNDETRQGPIKYDDIEGMWASANQGYFAMLRRQAPDFGFYAYAQAAMARKYGLTTPSALNDSTLSNPEHRHVYEIVSGGSAVTDSLQINRILKPNSGNDKPIMHVSALAGVEVPEHPWAKMIGDKKPAPEPLASLIPFDNYYVRFRNLEKLNEFGELLDQWGNNLMHAFEYRTRDYALRDRYERQLCLPSRQLVEDYPGELLKGVAITGSDPYLRDGSDVAVIFHVADTVRLVKLLDGYVESTCRALGGNPPWTAKQQGTINVESCVTLHRVVSMHRAVLGEFVVCANSPVGLQRILDARSRKSKPLSDSLDFRFMRVCFKANDKKEDGFAFLSDAFIRRLAGPADRIKQSRRAEAMASLQMATNGALLNAWHNARIPQNTRQLTDSGWVTPRDLQNSGGGVEWNGELASSERYGTIRFATPLLELPIDWITADEKAEYERFRTDYNQLWRRFFDPVGMRFHQNGDATVVEAFILPLVASRDYEILRALSQGGPAKLDLSKVSSKTMLYLMSSLSFPRSFFGNSESLNGSVFLRVDDDKVIKEIVEQLIDMERNGRDSEIAAPRFLQKLGKLPLLLGVEGDVVESIKPLLPQLELWLRLEEFQRTYRGITIEERRLPVDHELIKHFNLPGAKEVYQPTFYYAEIGQGLYFSLREEMIKELIDQHNDKASAKHKGPDVNAAVRLIPKAASDTRAALNMYFEWQTHRRALMSNPVWFALHRAKVIPKGSSESEEWAIARQYLGYVPMSPDKSGCHYDPRTGEVVNRRHGSWRQPILWPTLAADAPLRKILDQTRAIQLELRFREDGVHTTVKFEKEKK